MEKIILGIDPGIADTGYGIIKKNGTKLTCLGYGSIKTTPNQDLADRLTFLYQELNEIIKRYQPQVAAIEKLFFNKNTKTALMVAQARGVSLLALFQNKLPICEFTPSQVKQAVSAYGQAGKDQVQKIVKLTLKLEELPHPDDAADALAVAICALNYNLCLKRKN
jgi:crossover junction endodeoxyribonuclease RuvC